MKAQGAGEDNPELAHLHSILSAVQQQHMLQKQRALFAQQQQQQQQQQHQLRQQQQQQQNNAAISANGMNGWTLTTLNVVSQFADD